MYFESRDVWGLNFKIEILFSLEKKDFVLMTQANDHFACNPIKIMAFRLPRSTAFQEQVHSCSTNSLKMWRKRCFDVQNVVSIKSDAESMPECLESSWFQPQDSFQIWLGHKRMILAKKVKRKKRHGWPNEIKVPSQEVDRNSDCWICSSEFDSWSTSMTNTLSGRIDAILASNVLSLWRQNNIYDEKPPDMDKMKNVRH